MKNHSAVFWLCFLPIFTAFPGYAFAQSARKMNAPRVAVAPIGIAYDSTSRPIGFGVSQLEKVLQKSGQSVGKKFFTAGEASGGIAIRVLSGPGKPAIGKEGYRIDNQAGKILITAADAVGAMYGAMDVAEQLQMGKTLKTLTAKTASPHLDVRALKVNLPWLPYRTGPAMDVHLDVCKDLAYWQRLLDMMAKNRFNTLSLWNVHPFSFMVKPTNFPLANNFSESEMADWKQFWTALFRMAKERGIEPYLVNWNIAVSPEFAKNYGVMERNDTSAVVKRYTREVVAQVIDEYPDLAGIGITLADWMSNFSPVPAGLPVLTPKDREDWIEQTVVAGIKGAKRPVRFIHRSVLSSEPGEMRRVINNANLPDTALVEIKFNWSHGHSTPTLALTHDSHSGQRDDGYWNPLPTNYRIQWMVRNEDFFILRWGQPAFIRQHIAQNKQPYVNGYFVGSEGYIPAKDYSHVASTHRTWDYAFEKQWLFYELWGRLMYDPTTPDALFEASFAQRYGPKSSRATLGRATLGRSMLEATAAAGQMPLRLASFFKATWDYTLYSEGFLSPMSPGGLHDDVSSFISIDELIDHATLDPTYVSIKDYAGLLSENKLLPAGKVSPLALANLLEADSRTVLTRVEPLRPNASPTLACELADLETWAYLSLYFADKLRAGVALQTYRLSGNKLKQQEAIALLTKCLAHWRRVSDLTASHYHEVPYIEGNTFGGNAHKDALRFSWINYLPQVERDVKLAGAVPLNVKK
ncbi:MAG: glycoside hydrolase family 20 zincin-like fold domain-containing protein [Cytophagaceae bacterium]|nr:glycoside hydrolase family 20 zincin-like fold domain-containing protein [Cytophagaceae bacterium]